MVSDFRGRFGFFCFFSASLFADQRHQLTYAFPDSDTRFSFAQLYGGMDYGVMPAGGDLNGEAFDEGAFGRLVIGGLHFWGHADFYVAFPVGKVSSDFSGGRESRLSPGLETGFKYYPYALSPDRVRPYVGLSWAVRRYRERDAGGNLGPDVRHHVFPLSLGISYVNRFGIWDLGVRHVLSDSFDYYVSETQKRRVELPEPSYVFGYKYLIDTTAMKKGDQYLVELVDRPQVRDAWFAGVGVSSQLQLREDPYNRSGRSFFDDANGLETFPELGVGYYVDAWHAAVNLSYRGYDINRDAFGVHQEKSREALSLEAFKFFGDYYGFVPFLGFGLSYERLGVKELDNGVLSLDESETFLRPSLIMGWDIRPTRYPIWLLRTNIRYTFNNQLDTQRGAFRFDDWEFNFIQFVLFPERLWTKSR